jgi:hypothetical protein
MEAEFLFSHQRARGAHRAGHCEFLEATNHRALVLSFLGGTSRARAKYDKISGGIREKEPEDIHDVVLFLEEKQRVIQLFLYVFWKARGRARHKH